MQGFQIVFLHMCMERLDGPQIYNDTDWIIPAKLILEETCSKHDLLAARIAIRLAPRRSILSSHTPHPNRQAAGASGHDKPPE